MKYSLFFAATVAAYDAYGGYGGQSPSSSVPAKISSAPVYGGYGDKPVTSPATSAPPAKATPCSTSVGKNGYTTVVPGYGKPPVTVTTQHQAYPTCASAGYDGKTCNKWEEDKYVSTTITDYNKKVVTITKIQDYVTAYYEKKTITNCATSTASGYGSVPTGASKNGTWYELYEKVHLVQYKDMGKNVLVGYSGSGLCQACDSKQPVIVKEYKGGKWTEEKKDLTYGKPKEEVKVYEKPGVYTVPAKVVTVDYPVTYIDTATKTAKAGETCTYGGQYKEVKSTGTVTGTYGSVETKVVNGKTETVMVTKTATVYCGKVGQCEICPATTTVYTKDTTVTYPTAKVNEAGVYHYNAEVITITKPNQAYTCKYEATATPASKTPSYPASKTPSYPASKTPTYQNDYGYKASATPTPQQPSYNGYPSYPVKSNNTSSAGNGGYGDNWKPSTTPCSTLIKVTSTPSVPIVSKPVYGGDNSKPSTTPAVGYPPVATPPAYNNGGYGDNSKPSSSVPSKPVSTPCDDDKKKATPTPSAPVYNNNGGYGDNVKATPTPAAYNNNNNGGYGDNTKPTPTPVQPVYPGASAGYGKTSYGKRAGFAERRNAM